MRDFTALKKALIGCAAGLAHPVVALSFTCLIYGREVGQEQQKLRERMSVDNMIKAGNLKRNIKYIDYVNDRVSVVSLGIRGGFIWQWSKGNQLDFIGALLGSIIGVTLWLLYIKPLWSA